MFASIRSALRRLKALVTRRRLDEEFDHEIESHLALLTEENIRRGMSPEQARYAALRSFGGVTQVKEDNREHRAWHEVEIMLQDLRYAFHGMRKKRPMRLLSCSQLSVSLASCLRPDLVME